MDERGPEACPIADVIDVLFSRWTTPILWALHERGRQRFGDLERHVPGISPKVLTQRLRQLERDGLVARTYHAEVPPRVEYEITALGASLEPLFTTLSTWGATNMPAVEQSRRAYDA
ncbi:helix-turn-helix transcriptional regulator [Actinoplanes sp. TRM 88003]|uniref:Helix-turn-helix transcriptional regulator n=1 Tax=Paractinoplanes aksuensis TaxID=2939490 RepID=A0ABT1DFC2_9ACTN|nr:helix-turn-helix domain-containing protein [Actinoplanes aksuensis]MCO8269489.1 helix-turn-helix transcriptional regulator [Actinoplanes aksuensis]